MEAKMTNQAARQRVKLQFHYRFTLTYARSASRLPPLKCCIFSDDKVDLPSSQKRIFDWQRADKMITWSYDGAAERCAETSSPSPDERTPPSQSQANSSVTRHLVITRVPEVSTRELHSRPPRLTGNTTLLSTASSRGADNQLSRVLRQRPLAARDGLDGNGAHLERITDLMDIHHQMRRRPPNTTRDRYREPLANRKSTHAG